MSAPAKLTQNFIKIKRRFNRLPQKVFTPGALEIFLSALKEEGLAGVRTTVDDLVQLFIEAQVLRTLHIDGFTSLTRYSKGTPSPLDVGVSITPRLYYSHFTALFLNGLVSEKGLLHYLTLEQDDKAAFSSTEPIKQQAVDRAFCQPQRSSNTHYTWKETGYRLLKGRDSYSIGITSLQGYRTTDLERTLIDCTVRPAFSGGAISVCKAFQNAKPYLSPDRLFHYLQSLNYRYPYHQAIGFYLQGAGFSADVLRPFKELPQTIRFYLDYGMEEKDFDETWQIYVPPALSSPAIQS